MISVTEQIKVNKLKDMHKGWFIGNFEPTVFQTEAFEVAVKHYKAGDSEPAHFHKGAREFTVIVSGKVQVNDVNYEAGDILTIQPNTEATFKALTDVVTTVVKVPGVKNDKFLVENA